MTCCIVIPIYRETLPEIEEIYFRHNVELLRGSHDIHIVCPKSLDVAYYQDMYPDIKVDRVANKFFKSLESYSQLCTSALFYRLYKAYDYMLICQTDAVMFSDKLDHFMQMGYDYYGGPLDSCRDENNHPLPGQGGLSLRNVSTMIDLCEKYPNPKDYHPEDYYFASVRKNEINICPLEVAEAFAYDCAPEEYYKGTLPMGCHKPYGWNHIWWLGQKEYVAVAPEFMHRQIFNLTSHWLHCSWKTIARGTLFTTPLHNMMSSHDPYTKKEATRLFFLVNHELREVKDKCPFLLRAPIATFLPVAQFDDELGMEVMPTDPLEYPEGISPLDRRTMQFYEAEREYLAGEIKIAIQ